MPSKPPFYAQSKPETCALVCLRRVLAHEGVDVTEEELIQRAAREPGGVNIEELARLARNFGLAARIERLDPPAIVLLIQQDVFPIVYVQLLIAGEPTAHAVIPIEIDSKSITVLDPLALPPGERQLLMAEFTTAQAWLGNVGGHLPPLKESYQAILGSCSYLTRQ